MMSVEDTVRTTDTLDIPASGLQNEFTLANSFVVAEYGPAGLILRIERRNGWNEYAGPFADPVAIIDALSEVSQ